MVEKMTPTEKLIAEARELDRRATQGTWYAEKKGLTVHGFDLEYRICVVDGGTPVYANPIGGSRPAADREFIIRSRTLLPALCDDNERLRKELEQAQNAQRWIPVTERLPESGQEVWICEHKRVFHIRWGRDMGFHPSHWMPYIMPEPPKGED